jgi:predicted PurR-regulated permease PerM
MKLFGKPEKSISITTETIAKTIFLTVAAVLLLNFISQVTHQLTLIAVSAFFAIALNPAVNWLYRRLKSKSRIRATGIAYLIVLTVLVSFLALVVPPLVKQTTDFIKDIPATIDEFRRQDSAIARAVRRYDLDEQLVNLRNDFSSRVDDLTGPVFSTASRIGGTLVSIITVLVLTFMMLTEGPLWYERIMALQPEGKRKRRKEMAIKMYRVITGYVNGQVLIAAIAAGFALITLLIASTLTDSSVNAVALAGIVFLFGLIPLIGNILAAAIVVLFSLFASSALAIIMAIYFLLYQQIENITLQPYIQSRGNQLTPLTVFAAALLGVGFGGILGALAAIPIAGCIRVLLEDKLQQRLPDTKTLKKEPA